MDITNWIICFLNCLTSSFSLTDTLAKILTKANFWKKHAVTILNTRQHKMINKLLDGFTGKMTTSKWAKICKCFPDTALLDIQDLIKKIFFKRKQVAEEAQTMN